MYKKLFFSPNHKIVIVVEYYKKPKLGYAINLLLLNNPFGNPNLENMMSNIKNEAYIFLGYFPMMKKVHQFIIVVINYLIEFEKAQS
jgi:hypothetical protein